MKTKKQYSCTNKLHNP